MPNKKTAGPALPKMLRLLKALATPLRLRLLLLLRGHRSPIALPLILAELQPQRASVSNVTEQLQILIAEGLVESERAGRKVFYGLSPGIANAVSGLESMARNVEHGE